VESVRFDIVFFIFGGHFTVIPQQPRARFAQKMSSLPPASNAGARRGLHPYRTPQQMVNEATSQLSGDLVLPAPEARSHTRRHAHRSRGSEVACGDTVGSHSEQPSQVFHERWHWSLWDDVKVGMSAGKKLQLVTEHRESFAGHGNMMPDTVFRSRPQDLLQASAQLAPTRDCRLSLQKSLLVASSIQTSGDGDNPLLVAFGRRVIPSVFPLFLRCFVCPSLPQSHLTACCSGSKWTRQRTNKSRVTSPNATLCSINWTTLFLFSHGPTHDHDLDDLVQA
jgi:hypothetical protein